jgi:hypothetical protein
MAHAMREVDPGNTFADFAKHISTHVVSEDRKVDGWAPGLFYDDGIGKDTKGRRKLHKGGYRNINAAMQVGCLVFDIDGGGKSVDEMTEYLAMAGLSCVLVTSYSHGKIDLEQSPKPQHRYRIIFEIDKPVTVPHAADITKRMKEKQAFNQLFTNAQKIAANKDNLNIPGVDPSALGIAQFFFGPAHPKDPGLNPCAQVFTGEPFDFSDCMKQAEREHAQQQHKHASNGAGNPTQRDGLHLRAEMTTRRCATL